MTTSGTTGQPAPSAGAVGGLLVVGWPVLALAPVAWLARPHLEEGQALVRTALAGQVPPLPEIVVVVAAGALALCWLWLVAGAGLVAWQTLRPSSRVAGLPLTWIPTFVRAAVAALVGSCLAAGPAHADLTGLPLPDRAATATASGVADGGRSPGFQAPRAPALRVVLVRPGDSLWRIADDQLRRGASVAEVDRAWRRIARANAARVPDPHVIAPGLRLRIPPLHDRKDPR